MKVEIQTEIKEYHKKRKKNELYETIIVFD